ncbi:hypothetical protein H8356DRAFT_1419995 [Neocallimastix lanati (nom. inval.)]|nr:hypothetical protein H8356DRAFT_1419995 [Neocallimastix sp. JGI-2020a]
MNRYHYHYETLLHFAIFETIWHLKKCDISPNCNSPSQVILTSHQREITNWRCTRRSSTSKILSNNMHVRTPMLKCNYLNIPTAPADGVTSLLKFNTNQSNITNEEVNLLDKFTYEVTKKNFVTLEHCILIKQYSFLVCLYISNIVTWVNFMRIILRQYGIKKRDSIIFRADMSHIRDMIKKCIIRPKKLSYVQNIFLTGYVMYKINLSKSRGDKIDRRNNLIDEINKYSIIKDTTYLNSSEIEILHVPRTKYIKLGGLHKIYGQDNGKSQRREKRRQSKGTNLSSVFSTEVNHTIEQL